MAQVQRVLVVDDHRIFVQLLASALSAEPDLQPVGVAHDTVTALKLGRELRPDLIVMDVRLGDGDGIAVARELADDLPDTKVVVLTAFSDAGLVRAAADSGACALLAKNGDLGVLLSTLRAARRGSFTVGTDLPPPAKRPDDRLTLAGLEPESTDLLRLLAAGFDTDGVARELAVTRTEAQRRIDHLVTVLRANGPVDAVAVGIRRGLFRVGYG
ncbi:MAG: response regulator transcription factor [Dermatophilaceae bacterium]|nr:response regulator transcription factor [Intrasporangiaceae bacterium]